MKDGFTLVELLVVIVITLLVSAGSSMIFKESNAQTNEEDLKGKYIEIQRSAIIFADLEETYRKALNENRELNIRLGELQNRNYVSKTLKNTVTKEKFPRNYIVKLYIASTGDNEYLDSCIISYTNESEVCVSNSRGDSCGCCDFEVSQFNKAC